MMAGGNFMMILPPRMQATAADEEKRHAELMEAEKKVSKGARDREDIGVLQRRWAKGTIVLPRRRWSMDE